MRVTPRVRVWVRVRVRDLRPVHMDGDLQAIWILLNLGNPGRMRAEEPGPCPNLNRNPNPNPNSNPNPSRIPNPNPKPNPNPNPNPNPQP